MFTRDYTSSVRVMTYNIRMDTVSDGINQWNLHRNRVFRLIQQYQPDLIGIQEALSHQLADLHAACPAFWLSETPDTPGSKGWDPALPRVCSWVKLKDRRNNQKLYHCNTHLDHVGQIARRQSTRLILARIQTIAGPMTPTILTGDFNVGPQSDVYRTIVRNTSFRDTKYATQTPHHGPSGTWSTFDIHHGIGKRIDYIFISSQHF